MIALYILATFCVVPALHRYSFTIVLGTKVALEDDSSLYTPRLKTSWPLRGYILKPQQSPGEKYIVLFYRFGTHFYVISANT